METDKESRGMARSLVEEYSGSLTLDQYESLMREVAAVHSNSDFECLEKIVAGVVGKNRQIGC